MATAVALVSTSVFPILLASRIKKPAIPGLASAVRVVQVSTLLLGLFLLTHGLYHASEFVGNDFYSDLILGPISVLCLLMSAVYVKMFLFVPRSKIVRAKAGTTFSGKYSLLRNKTVPIIIAPFALLQIYLSIVFGQPAEVFTLLAVVFSALIYGWMAIKNPMVGSLHFEFALITLIWAAAEIPHALSALGLFSIGGIDVWGTWVHFLSMLLVGVFVCYRTLTLSLFSPKDRKELVSTNKQVVRASQ